MRIVLTLALLSACTVPAEVPVQEDRARETGIAEAPQKPPPKPKPPKTPPASTVLSSPPCLPTSNDPKKRVIQELDCMIKDKKTR
jgi:hypothetical protein